MYVWCHSHGIMYMAWLLCMSRSIWGGEGVCTTSSIRHYQPYAYMGLGISNRHTGSKYGKFLPEFVFQWHLGVHGSCTLWAIAQYHLRPHPSLLANSSCSNSPLGIGDVLALLKCRIYHQTILAGMTRKGLSKHMALCAAHSRMRFYGHPSSCILHNSDPSQLVADKVLYRE